LIDSKTHTIQALEDKTSKLSGKKASLKAQINDFTNYQRTDEETQCTILNSDLIDQLANLETEIEALQKQ
jgi:hypothetical protein